VAHSTATAPAAQGTGDGMPAIDPAQPLVNQTRPPGAPPEVIDLSLRVQSLERKQRWVTAALALAVLVAVAWPLALAAYAMLHSPEKNNSGLPLPGLKSASETVEPAGSPAQPAEASAAPVGQAAAREASAH
jgi:hypothetical protein